MANKPIPTKFDPGEDALIRVLVRRSGLPVAQVVRRCIRLMGAEVKRRGRDWNWVEETATPFFDRAIMEEFAANNEDAANPASVTGDVPTAKRTDGKRKRA